MRVRGSSSIDGWLSARLVLVPGPQRASVAAGVASTAGRRLLSAAGRGGLPGFVYPCSGLPERTPRKPVERRRDVTVGHSIPYDARTTSDAVGTVALQTRTTIMLMDGTAHATTRLRRRRMRTRPVQVLHDGWTARHRGGQRGSTARIGRVNQIRPTISGVQTLLQPPEGGGGRRANARRGAGVEQRQTGRRTTRHTVKVFRKDSGATIFIVQLVRS